MEGYGYLRVKAFLKLTPKSVQVVIPNDGVEEGTCCYVPFSQIAPGSTRNIRSMMGKVGEFKLCVSWWWIEKVGLTHKARY